jgi:hypothetical protein
LDLRASSAWANKIPKLVANIVPATAEIMTKLHLDCMDLTGAGLHSQRISEAANNVDPPWCASVTAA